MVNRKGILNRFLDEVAAAYQKVLGIVERLD